MSLIRKKTRQLERNRVVKNIYHEILLKASWFSFLISGEIDFKTKSISRTRDGHFI